MTTADLDKRLEELKKQRAELIARAANLKRKLQEASQELSNIGREVYQIDGRIDELSRLRVDNAKAFKKKEKK
jgi:chromosome segregation ATPase